MNNVTGAFNDGLTTMKDSLIDLFADTTKLYLKTRDAILKELDNTGKISYASIVANAVTGAGILFGIKCINGYKNENSDAIEESLDSTNMLNRIDDITFSTLDLQENLIKAYNKLKGINNSMIKILEGNADCQMIKDILNDSDLFGAASAFIYSSVKTSSDPSDLHSEELSKAFDIGISAVAALYDEYIQDFCGAGAGDEESTTVVA